MSSRSVSPGGALLRASRVFSIPPPLPRPTSNLSSTAIFQSDSATLPHPINLSITTPQSSLAKGDWGFKRPLPRRSTRRTSTPIIRVEAIDTFERITEFGSAADHSLTLQKWQEMGLPITTPPIATVKRATHMNSEMDFTSRSEGTGLSVFEDSLDSTFVRERGLLEKDDTRWKFNGPWLAGLNEGEFNDYIHKQIRGRKLEFRQFLRTACAEDMTRDQRRLATEGEGEGDFQTPVQAKDVTEEQLDEYIRTLRGDIQTLYGLIRKFLDLPPPPNRHVANEIWETLTQKNPKWSLGQNFINSNDYVESDSPYANTGPPKTHPSAGLSYARSSAYLYNHPVYGPQKHKPPVQARIVMPRGASTGNFGPIFGVGGFTFNPPANESSFNIQNGKTKIGKHAQGPTIPGLMHVEPDKVGGSKAWVEPKSASIDSKGKVMLLVSGANEEAVAVKEERTHEIPPRPVVPRFEDTSPNRATRQLRTPNLGVGYEWGISSRDFKR